jgi:hypothetical protein
MDQGKGYTTTANRGRSGIYKEVERESDEASY